MVGVLLCNEHYRVMGLMLGEGVEGILSFGFDGAFVGNVRIVLIGLIHY